jgi:class 3 adenylate cyclase
MAPGIGENRGACLRAYDLPGEGAGGSHGSGGRRRFGVPRRFERPGSSERADAAPRGTESDEGLPARPEGEESTDAIRHAGTEVIPEQAPGALERESPIPGHLILVEGPSSLRGHRFPLCVGETSIGRTKDCHVSILETSVSRCHATLVSEGDALVLVHRSQTNGTFVNGEPVEDRQRVFDGDQIQLADRVVLQLEAPAHRAPIGTARARTLREAMEARVDLDERIEREFLRDGSFLDVDVVDSFGMKSAEPRSERVVVSFERFRAFVTRTVTQHRGDVLNCNGDEVMTFFRSADDSVAAGRAIVTGLARFNENENLLGRPFRVRAGIHTGRSAVDLASGIAYSPVLDAAGHLQKAAPVDGLLISEETASELSSREGLVKAEAVPKHAIETYRVVI